MTDRWYLEWIGELDWCRTCEGAHRIVDIHEEEVGNPDQPLLVLAINLYCGHDLEVPLRMR